jgi:hypothetical protein
MAMGTGAKIAIGCGCLVLLGGAAVVGLVGWGAWWAKDKLNEAAGGLETFTAKAEEIERWERQANANAYAASPDGLIPEDRLLKFLETRKAVYAVYERYEADLEQLRKQSGQAGDTLSPTELWSAGGKVAEVFAALRLAQMKTLAAVGMSEEEYRAIQVAVYKWAWASDVEKGSGKMPAEAVSGSMAEAAKGMEDAVRAGLEAAQQQGVPGAGGVSTDDVRKLQEEMARLGQDAGEALAVPRENVELFRKHEAEIKKYAMTGLALVGL